MTIRDVSNFAVLLILFMYILALVGMQIFANRLRFDADGLPVSFKDYDKFDPTHKTNKTIMIQNKHQPQAHFDTLGWALVTIFQVLSGENWNVVLYDCMRGAGLFKAPIFFLILVIMGNFIILNLFLAILLINFDGLSEAQEQEADSFEEKGSSKGVDDNASTPNGIHSCLVACIKSKTTNVKVRPEVMFDKETMSRNKKTDTPLENFSFNSPKSMELRDPQEYDNWKDDKLAKSTFG